MRRDHKDVNCLQMNNQLCYLQSERAQHIYKYFYLMNEDYITITYMLNDIIYMTRLRLQHPLDFYYVEIFGL